MLIGMPQRTPITIASGPNAATPNIVAMLKT